MRLTLSILFFSFATICHAQFPIGKNIKTAKVDIIKALQVKGFHLFKSEEMSKGYDLIKFSEEFSVFFGKNNYENAYTITFSTFKKSIYEKLKKIYSFPNWTYTGEFPNITNEIESVYTYKTYRIRMPHPDGAFQFIINSKDNE